MIAVPLLHLLLRAVTLCAQSSLLLQARHSLSLTHVSIAAEYISLLFTDLGVLTPAAVSDELIQLYV